MKPLQYMMVALGRAEDVPKCSRCGGDSTAHARGDELVVITDSDDRTFCNDCLTTDEKVIHGERLLEGLSAEADAIRRRWLGDDYDRVQAADDKLTHRQLVQKHGPPPAELRALLNQSDKLEELLEEMRFVGDADPRWGS